MTEENWETEQVDLMIDNTFKLYEAKQRLLWAVTRVTPFDVARFVKSWRPTLDAEFKAQRMTLPWIAVQYDVLAKTWNLEMLSLVPRTIEQAIHVGEILAEKHRKQFPIPDDDKFHDLSPFKVLHKSMDGFEHDCACLVLCIGIGVDISQVKIPMPTDYDDEGERKQA